MSEIQEHSFLTKIVEHILTSGKPLQHYTIVLPGKRPAVFIKRILSHKNYRGILPKFITIDELITEISALQSISGIPLWLLSYKVYQDSGVQQESLQNFLKWYPTLLKDWDDILKFTEDGDKVLDFMHSDERIKNWGETLGEDQLRKKHYTFWKKANTFLPALKQSLLKEGLGTSGIIHEKVKKEVNLFIEKTEDFFLFCGFNAFTLLEKKLIKGLLQAGKADCFFQADRYYFDDTKQEAGKFLRENSKWKEFNDQHPFSWIDQHFEEEKNIEVYEVSGNIAQTKVLPQVLKNLQQDNKELSHTAIVLMDENILPPTLASIKSTVKSLNITMGFPLKNLSFSIAMKKLFYLQKQLMKSRSSYYHADLTPILEEMPANDEDLEIIRVFIKKIKEKNMVYISSEDFKNLLGGLSYFNLLCKPNSAIEYLEALINFCKNSKLQKISDIDFENISSFESAFVSLRNQLLQYNFLIEIETLEVLIHQMVSSETIDFEGEPLSGLQVMGLLETRLLNFENIILLSVNEGKIPLGRSQNTYLPFDVRRKFGLNTYLENDSIYAYHFYRLIQEAKNVHIVYNGLSSGLNTGERSRFVTQIEMESSHTIHNHVVESVSQPIEDQPIEFSKSDFVKAKLAEWKNRISPSHLTSYLYNPVNFYLQKILGLTDQEELEEEVTSRNYGNLVHYTLEKIYSQLLNKKLEARDIIPLKAKIEDYLNEVIVQKMNNSLSYYDKGMNYIHKTIAKKTIENILQYDIDALEAGSNLEILAIEKQLKGDFQLSKDEKVSFYGYADRIDRMDGVLRILDYKTSDIKYISMKNDGKSDINTVLNDEKYKQLIQLAIYSYCILQDPEIKDGEVQCGIWSFKKPSNGPGFLSIDGCEFIDTQNIQLPMLSIRTIIKEILNPDIDFIEKKRKDSFFNI
ncbi:PD-(D/E)XK nuclease family protein [Elizabethkingia sp. JS20170427COW]|uniref:PD-(D/E)XK nuclease family protein n=1 Tax=Elizabethkingia sp. JS20170427COW TaxID=2583851 RepID=UPI0011105901|nr:PD-(D/E)XK nuclease family protein [Elizabethkingia sp. JS20170427COW]QCX54246.1 PD-(D/E)XK nuclease family protein [Elizabethkingia sp. JS20170427COW]